MLEIKDGYFRYERGGKDILNGFSVKAYAGEIVSVVGSNGSGKTTFLCASAGIINLYRGKILYNGMKNNHIKAAYLPQNPQTLFISESVKEELYSVFSETDYSDEIINAKINAVIKLCGLEKITERHPYDISGGEQQKTALAKILLTSPRLLLLDEPVKGVDIKSKNEIGIILRKLAQRGLCIVMVSHDMTFCAQYSDRCAMMFEGQLIGMDEPHRFFCGNEFYTTETRMLTKGIIDNIGTININGLILLLASNLPLITPNAPPPTKIAGGPNLPPEVFNVFSAPAICKKALPKHNNNKDIKILTSNKP